MKTFEGLSIRGEPSGTDDTGVIFPMYLLRAISVTVILSLFFYIADRLLNLISSEIRFPEFMSYNILALISMSLFFFLFQALFYWYRVRRKASVRRSTGEIIIGYLLPVIGIIAAVYTAYAVGAM
jgi:small-conductance mechanosensitive channel